MLAPYREVLAVPGARAFSAAGFVARMPISMVGLAIVLLVEGSTGSYGLAGTVAATYGLVQAVAAPRVAALVDRYGQGRVLRPTVVVHTSGLLALLALAELDGPRWALFPLAAVAGAAVGSVGAYVRARWSYVLGDQRRRHAAYSLESVLDEAIFIVGPIAVTLLATKVAPAWAVVLTATAALTGGLVLATLAETEPPPARVRQPAGTGVLRSPGMVVLLVAFLFAGGIFGATEVTTVAFTEEEGRPGAAGIVLACFAFGSMVAGLVYGAVHWTSPAGRRFAWGMAGLGLGVVPFLLVESILALCAVMVLAGLAISPMIISGNQLVQDLVVPGRLTEGLTWVATALGVGVAGGAAASGWTVEHYGASTAFLTAVLPGLLGAATVLAGSRWLLRPPQGRADAADRAAVVEAAGRAGQPPAGGPPVPPETRVTGSV